MIQFRHVYKTYGSDRHSLRDVSFNIQKGEFAFLTGPSGAGKTTLFKLISAYENISSGEVSVLGHDLGRLKKGQIPFLRRKIGFVLQNCKLLKSMTVLQNIELPLKILGVAAEERTERAESILTKVGLSEVRDQFPDFLSGGEQQRVSIARALVHNPELVIADEPTGNLDPDLSDSIMRVFHSFAQNGATFLIATHDHRLIGPKGSRLLKLDHGLLIEDIVL